MEAEGHTVIYLSTDRTTHSFGSTSLILHAPQPLPRLTRRGRLRTPFSSHKACHSLRQRNKDTIIYGERDTRGAFLKSNMQPEEQLITSAQYA